MKGKKRGREPSSLPAIAIGKTFSDLAREASDGGICFQADAVKSASDVRKVKAALDTFGVVFLTEAISPSSCEQAKVDLKGAMESMFQYDLNANAVKTMPASLDAWNEFRNSKNGFGNPGFGFVQKQFTARTETPTTSIGGEEVFMAHNGVWSTVNLPLLEANIHTTALLLALTHWNGQVSIDSAKYASNPRPKPKKQTQQGLTPPHVDIYTEGEIERVQALIVDEAAVKLGFVVGSHRLAKEIGEAANVNLSTASGYVGLGSNEALKEAFTAGWLAPPPRSLVIWKSGVVHFEATSKPGSKQAHVFSSWSDQANAPRFRAVVGTHMPVNLEQADLVKLAVLGERSLIPDFYNGINSKATKLYPNIVNRKSTQYLVARTVSASERKMIQTALEGPADESAPEWQEMSPLRKHLVGVTQRLEQLPFGTADIKMIRKMREGNADRK